MSLRDEAIRSNPDFPWLEAGDALAIGNFMRDRGWLEPGEEVISCAPAGGGNMNLTLRVRTNRRDLVLKQSRPWVEKFDHIAAPWDRSLVEIQFYQIGSGIAGVRERMPALLATDTESRCFALEYIDGEGDFTFLYRRDPQLVLEPEALEQAAHYLASLHCGTLQSPEPRLLNTEMRQLNREHIFAVPLASASAIGLDLDSLESGLSQAAQSLREDVAYRQVIAKTEQRYLLDGASLLHGDFFPGSWLKAKRGLVVIDPEFCFFGAVEIDLGCAVAHLALSGQAIGLASDFIGQYRKIASGTEPEERWITRFASVEIMRRLIGVAQLPIPTSGTAEHFRRDLLERSRLAMLEGRIDILFD